MKVWFRRLFRRQQEWVVVRDYGRPHLIPKDLDDPGSNWGAW